MISQKYRTLAGEYQDLQKSIEDFKKDPENPSKIMDLGRDLYGDHKHFYGKNPHVIIHGSSAKANEKLEDLVEETDKNLPEILGKSTSNYGMDVLGQLQTSILPTKTKETWSRVSKKHLELIKSTMAIQSGDLNYMLSKMMETQSPYVQEYLQTRGGVEGERFISMVYQGIHKGIEERFQKEFMTLKDSDGKPALDVKKLKRYVGDILKNSDDIQKVQHCLALNNIIEANKAKEAAKKKKK
jgi:hypothetical protein